MDKQSISTLESESVAAVAMLNNVLAGRNRSASDVSRFRLSSVQLRNHEVGYFDPLLWAVRVMICAATFCIGGKCSVVLCLKNRKYGGVSSLSTCFKLWDDEVMAIFCPMKVNFIWSYIWEKFQGQSVQNAELCHTHSAIFHKLLQAFTFLSNNISVMAMSQLFFKTLREIDVWRLNPFLL